MLELVNFPKPVVVALAMTVKYISGKTTPLTRQLTSRLQTTRSLSSSVRVHKGELEKRRSLADDSSQTASTCCCQPTHWSICTSDCLHRTHSSEIYRNQTDGGLYGSLLWLLDQTKTKMGRRLMREWIGRPLLDIGYVEHFASCS